MLSAHATYASCEASTSSPVLLFRIKKAPGSELEGLVRGGGGGGGGICECRKSVALRRCGVAARPQPGGRGERKRKRRRRALLSQVRGQGGRYFDSKRRDKDGRGRPRTSPRPVHSLEVLDMQASRGGRVMLIIGFRTLRFRLQKIVCQPGLRGVALCCWCGWCAPVALQGC